MIRLLVFLLFMVSGTGLFYLVFVHELPRESASAAPSVPTSDVTLTTVHIKQHRGAALEWEVFADSAIYNESARQSLLTTVRFRVYQTGEEHPQPTDVRGTAGRALLDDARQRVLLQGKAHITKDATTEVRGEVIDYFVKDGIVKARGNVELRDKDAVVIGQSLDYNIRGERVVVTLPTLFQ
jgi:LPS export ABC transporter protein LptC